MAYSDINNDNIKREPTSHFHDLLHHQLSAENTRNTDHDSAEESGESPLDFSIKRKPKTYDEVSGSESLSSPASSLNETGGNLEDNRKNDNEHGNGTINRSLSRDSPPSNFRRHRNDNNFTSEHIRKRSYSVSERIGQSHTSGSAPASPSTGLPNNLNELQMGLNNANMLAHSFPTMAALMDPRRLLSSSKGGRPFNAYPKDALALGVSNAGLPSYLSSFANFENSISTQGISLSSEEIFNIYKQQLMSLRERDKYVESLRISQEYSPSRSSTVTSSPSMPSLPPSLSSISMHHSIRNNGINSNIMRDLPNSPTSPQSNNPSPIHTSNSDNGTSSSPVSFSAVSTGSRRRPRTLPDEQKDASYWERRRKNNEAAKRSRDARRAKEDQIAIRAALLEQENLKLRVEVAALKTETAKLRCMLYNS